MTRRGLIALLLNAPATALATDRVLWSQILREQGWLTFHSQHLKGIVICLDGKEFRLGVDEILRILKNEA